MTDAHASPDEKVIDLLADLLRIDTSNFGKGRCRGEAAAVRYVECRLRETGWDPVVLPHPEAPERVSLILRVPGREPELDALLVQQHLDVVPAEPDQWSLDPFGGEVRDGYIYGRGATDMKDMCATSLATLLDWGRRGVRPRRDIVFAFIADEEANGTFGAEWLVREHAELFARCTAAIGEAGAICRPAQTADGRTVRLYPIACGERGTMHIGLTAHGLSGHGSRPTGADAVHKLIEVVHRLGNHRWPLHLSTVVRAELEQTAAALGHEIDLSSESGVLAAVAAVGDACEVARYTIRACSTPTMLNAGYAVNVIPGVATAEVDVRCPPGYAEQLSAQLTALIGDEVSWEHLVYQEPIEAEVDSWWFEAMKASIIAFDPEAIVVPHCMGGGTDAKFFAELGMQNYGFSPLGPDPQGRRPEGIHSIDERNPVASIKIGQAMLQHFLEQV